MGILLKLVGILLLVDFITGIVHWLEDRFWSPETPVLGKWLIEPNLAHHRDGQAFLQKSWLESSWDLLLLGLFVVGIAYSLNCLHWEVWVFSTLIANANQIHKWAHITRDKNKPVLVGLLQKFYILQSTRHHGQHHRRPHSTHFCTVTNWLNPILDYMHFWAGLETLFKKRSEKNQY